MQFLFNKSAYMHTAGVILLVLAVSYNLGKIYELVHAKSAVSRPEGKASGMGNWRAIEAFAAVVEKNSFGIKGARFTVMQKKAGEVADPNGLVLKGVITHKPGFAFIENRAALQKLFKLGDDVFGAGRLSAVYADKVSISHNGKGFELVFPDIKTVHVKTQANALPVRQAGGNRKEMTFDREQIRKFLENPNELLTGARLMPRLKDGRQEGFIVREVKPGGFYENMGLRNEDIILRVNQLELNSPGDGVKIFNMIKELDSMDLDIVRNGVPMTQVFHIN